MTQTILTDVLIFVVHDVLGVPAEDAGGLIFAQNNGRAFHIDFQCVLLRNIKSTTKFDGKHDTTQFVNFSDNASGFQLIHPIFL